MKPDELTQQALTDIVGMYGTIFGVNVPIPRRDPFLKKLAKTRAVAFKSKGAWTSEFVITLNHLGNLTFGIIIKTSAREPGQSLRLEQQKGSFELPLQAYFRQHGF